MLEEAERRPSQRIEPRRAAADRGEKCNADAGIETQDVGAGAANIDRTLIHIEAVPTLPPFATRTSYVSFSPTEKGRAAFPRGVGLLAQKPMAVRAIRGRGIIHQDAK